LTKKKKQIKTQYQTPLGLLFLLEVKIFKGHNWVLLGKNKPIYVLIKHRPTIGNGLSYNQGQNTGIKTQFTLIQLQ
jgi:hypothetical protein